MARSNRRGRGNQPKVAKEPISGPEVRASVRTDSDAGLKLSWRLGAFDWDGPWGEKSLASMSLPDLLNKQIKSFESMSWSELRDKQHHSIECRRLNKVAKDRLMEIQQDDLDSIFSLRLQGQHRIYGIRDGGALKVLWVDLNHGDNSDCVCRSRKNHT